ncbi:ABC transporter permease [Pseudonocardia alni]|jgi:NitT/TauT family transport system permease protein|uniref:NitT/TauT family transport system permease protein n=2 Tax=Pseudonocardia alni TaxID=33907 RepID=A0A852VXM1_PSEA5|nr:MULTISPECIES: ABC transporter permease [Pseudonocardia]NWJ71951.1 ABC transporter permease [Pseudonocardia pini]OJG07708.1 putative aliphatic sulfonates transport permease protein SsuC [Pseudonocardia autotrophica]MBO4239557.1 ABC transporter permease subunit [Pseudonocardia alni]MCM3845305.1 ABC transporter permease [Pseudonocardia sp. DR1-2]MCO7193989.1 ABC transporter permease [Pseudonocardia sp. McavD-2-B]
MTTTERPAPATDPATPVTDPGGPEKESPWLRRLPWISGPVLLLLLVGAWQFTVSVVGVSEFILPAPAAVVGALGELLADPAIWGHIGVTLLEVLVGFGAALVAGVCVGALLGRIEWLRRAVQPALVALQVVPKVAFVPIFVIWFGFGPTSKIIMAGLLAFFPIMLNVMLGVRSVERGHRDVMTGLGASRWATFRNLELPATLPYVFAGAEVAIVFSVIGAIVGEYLGGSAGLGYLVVSSLNALDAPRLFAVIVLLAVLGSLLYLMVTTAKRLVIPWHESVNTGV